MLLEIAQGLGLGVLETHFSRKLVFYAFEIKEKLDLEILSKFCKKIKENQGGKRNNFCILFDKDEIIRLI